MFIRLATYRAVKLYINNFPFCLIAISFTLYFDLFDLSPCDRGISPSLGSYSAVWPDWAIYCTLDKFLKPSATINLSQSPPLLGNFVKVSKSFIFLVKSFLGNFYRHLVNFIWSYGYLATPCTQFWVVVQDSTTEPSGPDPIKMSA